jgi:hypothetical protein
MTILYIFAYLYVFWVLYLAIMGVYRAYLNNALTPVAKAMCLPLIVTGVLVDVIANVTIATVVFMQLPTQWLVTQRLSFYLKFSADWRHDTAKFVCENLLDVFDPTGKHCQ